MTFEQCATCEYSEIYWVCGHVDNMDWSNESWCPGAIYPTWECMIEELHWCDIFLKNHCKKWKKRKVEK